MCKKYCHECGKEMRKDGEYCVFCGSSTGKRERGAVTIQIPGDITEGLAKWLFTTDVEIYDSNENILWIGRQGETAKLFLDTTMRIAIHLGGLAKPVEGIVRSGKRYILMPVGGIHLRPVYALQEMSDT